MGQAGGPCHGEQAEHDAQERHKGIRVGPEVRVEEAVEQPGQGDNDEGRYEPGARRTGSAASGAATCAFGPGDAPNGGGGAPNCGGGGAPNGGGGAPNGGGGAPNG